MQDVSTHLLYHLPDPPLTSYQASTFSLVQSGRARNSASAKQSQTMQRGRYTIYRPIPTAQYTQSHCASGLHSRRNVKQAPPPTAGLSSAGDFPVGPTVSREMICPSSQIKTTLVTWCVMGFALIGTVGEANSIFVSSKGGGLTPLTNDLNPSNITNYVHLGTLVDPARTSTRDVT